jgi:hypothetical protein
MFGNPFVPYVIGLMRNRKFNDKDMSEWITAMNDNDDLSYMKKFTKKYKFDAKDRQVIDMYEGHNKKPFMVMLPQMKKVNTDDTTTSNTHIGSGSGPPGDGKPKPGPPGPPPEPSKNDDKKIKLDDVKLMIAKKKLYLEYLEKLDLEQALKNSRLSYLSELKELEKNNFLEFFRGADLVNQLSDLLEKIIKNRKTMSYEQILEMIKNLDGVGRYAIDDKSRYLEVIAEISMSILRQMVDAVSTENTQQNTQQNTQKNTQQNTQKNTQQNTQKNTQQNTQKNTKNQLEEKYYAKYLKYKNKYEALKKSME